MKSIMKRGQLPFRMAAIYYPQKIYIKIYCQDFSELLSITPRFKIYKESFLTLNPSKRFLIKRICQCFEDMKFLLIYLGRNVIF